MIPDSELIARKVENELIREKHQLNWDIRKY